MSEFSLLRVLVRTATAITSTSNRYGQHASLGPSAELVGGFENENGELLQAALREGPVDIALRRLQALACLGRVRSERLADVAKVGTAGAFTTATQPFGNLAEQRVQYRGGSPTSLGRSVATRSLARERCLLAGRSRHQASGIRLRLIPSRSTDDPGRPQSVLPDPTDR